MKQANFLSEKWNLRGNIEMSLQQVDLKSVKMAGLEDIFL